MRDEVDVEMFPGLKNTEELSATVKKLVLKQKLDFKLEYVRGMFRAKVDVISMHLMLRMIIINAVNLPLYILT